MPIYEFENTDTKEIFEKILSISSKEKYLAENKNVRQIMGIGMVCPDPVAWSARKMTPEPWRKLLNKMGKDHKGSSIDDFGG